MARQNDKTDSANGQPILVEISPGELWDKITILRIKAGRIRDADKVANVQRELAMLETASAQAGIQTDAIGDLIQTLARVNQLLWDVEDNIRDCERREEFGPTFVELARSVYRLNDDRGEAKRQINLLLGARIFEEKQYAKCD